MERYEFKDGASSKFWEAEVVGATLTVRFGRIGTAGQSKDKTFADGAAAIKEKDALVREKTKKGYLAAGAAPAPAKAAPVSAPAPQAAPPAAPVEPLRAARPALAPAGASFLSRPPLASRSRPAPARDPQACLAAIAEALAAPRPLDAKGGALQPWPTELRDTKLHSAMSHNAICAWGELLVASSQLSWFRSSREPQTAAARGLYESFAFWCVATQGPAVALQIAHALRRPADQRAYYGKTVWSDLVVTAFRTALSSVADKDFETAVAAARAMREGEDWDRDVTLAYLLADDREAPSEMSPLATLEAAAAAGFDFAASPLCAPLVAEAPSGRAKPWRIKQASYLYLGYCDLLADEIAATVIAAARGHGEPALPTLEWLLEYTIDEDRTALALAMFESREEGALATLLPLLHEKPVRAAVDRVAAEDPRLLVREALLTLSGGRIEPAVRARVSVALETYGADTVRKWAADAGPRGVRYLDGLLARNDAPQAPETDWPPVLRAPPWRERRQKTDDVVLNLTPIATPFALGRPARTPTPNQWRQKGKLADVSGLHAYIAKVEQDALKPNWNRAPPPETPLPPPTADEATLLAWLSGRLSQIARTDALRWTSYAAICTVVDLQPDGLARMIWNHPQALRICYIYDWDVVIAGMFARFGEEALPGLVSLTESDATGMLPLVAHVDAPAVAPIAARALLKLKKARAPAAAWLLAHPQTAAMRLLPAAIGPLGEARDAAEHALRFLNARAPEAVVAAVAAYGEAVRPAVEQVLTRDPLQRVPAKVARLPAWLTLSALSRPLLASGEALPDEAMARLCEMLSFVNPDDVYAGVAMVKTECEPASLSAFAWDLFSAWLAAGAPSKDGWTFRALGWFGDDEVVRQLTRLIRKWPGEAAHTRAVTGLDVLVDIGSDIALMNLNGIAEKLKFKGLQEKAREKIAALAEARDLTPEELADRLAPDLDLDARGGLDLDFGLRQFRVGFDEFLKPWVKDATGARLKDLPKPLRSDDPERAPEAAARWAALKKDARAIASLQLSRLENLLATQRRMQPDVFWTFFASHPLIRHLAQRLVWGVYGEGDAPQRIFRVTEELTFTNAEDEELSAQTQGLIGLVHPLHMSDADKSAWGRLFGDYEIAQPFPQLGRETYALNEEEKGLTELTRFVGAVVESARLRGMGARGWPTGAPQDSGCIFWIERPVRLKNGEARTAMLYFENGLYPGGDFEEKTQKLGKAVLQGDARQTTPFGELDALTASEVLRALTALATSGAS